MVEIVSYNDGGGREVTRGPSIPDWECSRKITAYSFISTSSVKSWSVWCKGHTQCSPRLTCAPITSISVCRGMMHPHLRFMKEFTLMSNTMTSSFSKVFVMILEPMASSFKIVEFKRKAKSLRRKPPCAQRIP